MQILLLTIFMLLTTPVLAASTFYVRTDGGTATQCTGLADAKYPGTGQAQACAFNHPFWAIAPDGNPSKMVGGDTLIIDGSNKAQYMMGLNAPNTANMASCGPYWPWGCFMQSVPSGPSKTQMTRILGKGWDNGCNQPPQLWGTERADRVLNLLGSSNVEVQCLEVTDHSDCQEFGPKACNRDTAPYGQWASKGLFAADSSNVLIKNVNIHGMAHHGVHAARLKDWTVEDSKIFANSFVGWDGDMGATASSNSGTITFTRTAIKYSGCSETYPGPGLVPFNCYSQDQGGYGDGLGTNKTKANWVFNQVDFSNNVSDGLDLLYHNGQGTITINGGKFNNNAGNNIKTATTLSLNGVETVGRCDWFNENPSYLWKASTFNNCRAGGNNLTLAFNQPGKQVNIQGGAIAGNGTTLIMTAGVGCDGTEKVTANGVTITPGTDYFHPDKKATIFYNSGDANGNGAGPCGQIKFINTNTPIPPTPPICVPNGQCSAPEPACGKVTTGQDNCGFGCQKTGPVCPPTPPVCPAPVLGDVKVQVQVGSQTYTLTK